ncbi:MAG: DNA replication/repair protein RecF [Clostridia bacterium]|nr:DNA replication/repair protein RecF [Clostridia bacterium]
MILKNLKLKNFRNYKELDIDLFDGINIFYGENAQGKTNILESIYIFSSSKSHRGVKDKELINFNEKESEISITFDSQKREQSAKFNIYNDKNKVLTINGISRVNQKALFGIFGTVIFSPEDLNLIKGTPEERRRFMDTDISQVRPEYFKILRDYKKVLNLKNNLLKSSEIDTSLLDVYDEKLSKLAAKITICRLRFTERINILSDKALFYISDKRENLNIKYKAGIKGKISLSVKEIEEKYYKEFKKIREEEILKKVTLIGPQRDDLEFYLNETDAKIYASQGQQRSIILSLKLAEFEFMKEVLGENPVLLLDDILSELDIKRQNKLLNFIRSNQTIITCTDKDLYEKIKYPYKSYFVENGRVK